MIEERLAQTSLAAGILRHGLRSLADCVLCQFSGQKKPDSGLDFARTNGGFLVVHGQAGRFSGDPLKDVVDERVHDAHGFAGDAGVGVDLLQHFVYVDRILRHIKACFVA